MPSSVTVAVSSSGWPTLAVSVFEPAMAMTGGLSARSSGLLVPAPSAPLSDMRSMFSISRSVRSDANAETVAVLERVDQKGVRRREFGE